MKYEINRKSLHASTPQYLLGNMRHKEIESLHVSTSQLLDRYCINRTTILESLTMVPSLNLNFSAHCSRGSCTSSQDRDYRSQCKEVIYIYIITIVIYLSKHIFLHPIFTNYAYYFWNIKYNLTRHYH